MFQINSMIKKNNFFNTPASCTETLKGLAIIIVLINHCLNLNFPGDFSGFATLFTAIFFLVSGYGIFNSLVKRYKAGISQKATGLFLFDRFTRIYPLLWLALIIELFVSQHKYPWLNYLGLNCVGQYWFVSAILQCYLLSPLLFYGLKKKPILVMIVLLSLNYVSLLSVFPKPFDAFFWETKLAYRGILFLHITIFYIGMCIAYFKNSGWRESNTTSFKQKLISYRNGIFWVSIALIVIFMIIAKYASLPSQVFTLIPFLPVVAITSFAVLTGISNKTLSMLGQISYPLYLFNISYYLIIKYVLKSKEDIFSVELILTLLLFPVFMYVCNLLEKGGAVLTGGLKWVFSRSPRQRV
jgi:peptidoglycan/LPS O-acetylase OafA/YrhL